MMKITKPTYKLYGAVFIVIVIAFGTSLFFSKSITSRYTLKVFENQQRWEYIVYKDNRPFIHQTCVPAVQGTVYFKDKHSARVVGNMVVEKLKQGKSPAISIFDLNSLNIIE